MAVTIDDLPGLPRSAPLTVLEDLNVGMLDALAARAVPAIGFVTEQDLHLPNERDARVAILQSWIDRRMDLGNHSYAHRGLSTTPLDTSSGAATVSSPWRRPWRTRRGGRPISSSGRTGPPGCTASASRSIGRCA